MPASVIPQPEPGRLPGPNSSHQPAISRKNGRSQRIVPNHGANVSVHQLVRLPWPGRISAMRVIAPRISRMSPTMERTTSGVNRAPIDEPVLRARLVVERALVRRRVAMRQTSTTTGKTIGRRLVCSYR